MDQLGTPQLNNQVSEEFLTEKLPVGWPWRLLVSAVILFGLSLFVYFSLQFGYSAYLTSESKKVDTSIEQLTKQVTSDDKEKFVRFYSQIVNLKKVLGEHAFTYNIFGFLERNTIPNVTYTTAAMEKESQTLSLDGSTSSFDSVAAQVAIFQKQPEVDLVSLDRVTLLGTQTVFTIKVTFTDDALAKPQI